jgi:hypothetical protein
MRGVVLMLVVGVDCVYYGLKSRIFVGLRDLWITGRTFVYQSMNINNICRE